MKEYLKKIQEDLRDDEYISIKDLDKKPITKVDQLNPGDVIVFSYKGSNYSTLVVSTKRGGRDCFFVSGKNNLLLSSIKINFNLSIHNMFLSQLYNKARSANYKKIAAKGKSQKTWLVKWFSFSKGSRRENLLSGLMGRNNFRTFIFKDMSQIIKLNLNV